MQVQLFQSSRVTPRLRLDPRTKLFLLLVVNIIMINGSINGAAAVYKPVLACLPLILLLTAGRTSAAIGYAVLFTLFWFAGDALLTMLSGVPKIILSLFSGLFTRWLPSCMMGYYLLATTRVSEFIAALERMRISPKIIIPLSVMFRFFPTVAEESAAINNSMRMRGIRMGGGNGGAIAMLEYRLVPLMMSTVKIGDELSAAALTKGLGGPKKRTNLCRIGFSFWDILFLICGTGFLIVYIVL